MTTFILKRILAAIPVMVFVALFVFSLLYLTPGDPALVIAGDRATPDEIERVREALGLGRPYLVRFGEWFLAIVQGDLGRSVFSGVPVSDLILQRLEPTVSLMVVTLAIATSVGVPMGVFAAWRAGGWVDRIVVSAAVLGFSVPVFVTGYALAWLFARELQWLPVQGYQPVSGGFVPWFRHLLLPSLAVSTVYVALIARITRSAMLEVLGQDYIRTATLQRACRSAACSTSTRSRTPPSRSSPSSASAWR